MINYLISRNRLWCIQEVSVHIIKILWNLMLNYVLKLYLMHSFKPWMALTWNSITKKKNAILLFITRCPNVIRILSREWGGQLLLILNTIHTMRYIYIYIWQCDKTFKHILKLLPIAYYIKIMWNALSCVEEYRGHFD